MDKLGSSFVSVGSVYCSIKTFVTFSRNSSRFWESCVGLPTCLYVVTLNRFWKYPRSIDRTSFLCTLTCVESGGRVHSFYLQWCRPDNRTFGKSTTQPHVRHVGKNAVRGIFFFYPINIENRNVFPKKLGFNEERVLSVWTGSEERMYKKHWR